MALAIWLIPTFLIIVLGCIMAVERELFVKYPLLPRCCAIIVGAPFWPLWILFFGFMVIASELRANR